MLGGSGALDGAGASGATRFPNASVSVFSSGTAGAAGLSGAAGGAGAATAGAAASGAAGGANPPPASPPPNTSIDELSAGSPCASRSEKYRTAWASAWIGAIASDSSRITMKKTTAESPIAPIDPITIAATKTIAKIATSTPKTCQPLPLTSFWLRPSASNTPGFSSTTTGAATAQIVIRKRPGMMQRTRPIAIPMPATMPTRNNGNSTGMTTRNSSPADASRRPSSWTSCTAFTTMPANQRLAMIDRMFAMRLPAALPENTALISATGMNSASAIGMSLPIVLP